MRVLLVEDATSMAQAIKRGLEAEGLLTDVVTDGTAGLDAALVGTYDAIVLDIMLPGMNGYDVCRGVREAGISTPVLMLSAKDGEYDQVDAFDLGADDYMVKPFSFPLLVARLRALIRRGGVPRPTRLVAGDLMVDPGTRRVRRGASSIDLTRREFDLLHHLIRHQGMALSKLDILQNVWDAQHDGTDTGTNAVEVYIGYLRRKVDEPFGRHSIQTVRGVGYRLVAESR